VNLDKEIVDLEKDDPDLKKGDDSEDRDSSGRDSSGRGSARNSGSNDDDNRTHHKKHKKPEVEPRTKAEDDFCVLGGTMCVCLAFYVLILYVAANESGFWALLIGVIIPLGLVLMTFGWRQAKKEGKQRIFLW